MGDSVKLWSDSPQICNVDPQVMPHFSFHAKCNYCEGIIPFTVEVERDMRKHYNSKHRLYCNACKKSDFNTKEELEAHLSTFHKDGVCFNCHGSFKLASAIAMHVEGPKNDCAVPHEYLIRGLRAVTQKMHNTPIDPDALFSPVSCCPGGEITMRGLKDFRKTLLLAHEKAFTYMKLQETSCNDLPADRSVGSNNNDVSDFVCVNTSKPFDAAAVADHETGCGSPQVKRMVSGDISNREDQESTASVLSKEWTCSTCVDAKFTSLSKLLQHVEQKVRNNWWMSLNS
ncbi:uncharacterized protein [Physcomitrium patens]|uniref:Uncharacterized protein n=1 Tax=Physcomitrium patens TaxID=3218 RepID=A0A2K1KMC0_PHYPA|nr:uncharacterized protein LOC112281030 [Physcomitrium patens]XP_024372929.1 uncharacterized protein LOC112281030 [Physcomitrium patens]PNR54928.1 hypothetical protein PHYPA_005821 [Physcomitrium patens]|eukprot:XP_024372927.1 uncharacterized protein LOC112281030 [Physcomitrella patens]